MYIRRSALIKSNPSKVWEEFTTFERISAWLIQGHKLHEFEPSLGGKVGFSVELEGAERFFGGEIIEFEEEKELSFNDDCDDKDFAFYASETTFWTYRLSRLDGSTLVEIFHHGYEKFGEWAHQALEDYEIGWDNRHLKKLIEIVENENSFELIRRRPSTLLIRLG